MQIKKELYESIAYGRLPKSNVRADGVYSQNTGKGMGGRDKLTEIRPSSMTWGEIDLLNWYSSVPFISRPVDRIADEMYREAFTIKTGDDELDKAIECRLTELDAYNQLAELERQTMIYRNGAIMYLPLTSDVDAEQIDYSKQVTSIKSILSINIVPAYDFSINRNNQDPTSALYNKPIVTLRGREIHPSRYYWKVNRYQPRLGYGISMIENLIEAGTALDISLWSLATMVYEAQIKVIKSNAKNESGKANIMQFVDKIKRFINSQSVVMLGETESFDKQNLTITGLADMTNFFWDALAFISEVPANILKGQAKRTINLSNDGDFLNFYSKIEHKQELARPYIKLLVDTILCEQCINKPGQSYDIEFEKLYIVDDNTQADIDLKNAQTDNLYFTMQVKNADDIQKERFPDLHDSTNEMLSLQQTGQVD